MTPYEQFAIRFKPLISKNPHLITTTLSNIFTMRLIGNKTHGDLAEIAVAEFINPYMYDFRSIHVGKDLYHAKQQEEDIKIINEITRDEFPVSLKAYGDGPLQLSTDKNFLMFPKLQQLGDRIERAKCLTALWADPVFSNFSSLNVLRLICDEKKQRCNVLVKNGLKYFESVTNGWITYTQNPVLVSLFSHALLSTTVGHEAALEQLRADIETQKSKSTFA